MYSVLPMTSDDQVVFSLIGLLVFALLIIILSVTLVFVRWQHKKKLRYIYIYIYCVYIRTILLPLAVKAV